MLRVGLTFLIVGCGLSHTRDADGFDAAESLDAGLDVACTLPMVAALDRISTETEATALFFERSTGACRFDCPDCGGRGWDHVLTFEVLLLEGARNRVTTTFGGVGSIEAVSTGTFVGDGLVRDIPWEEPTLVEFKPDGGSVTFTLHEWEFGPNAFTVTANALEL